MTPKEFLEFCDEHRGEFFAKFPKAGRGARAYWRDMVRHAHNALEDGNYQPETFDNAASYIRETLHTVTVVSITQGPRRNGLGA